ncbi:MAG: MTAP family purine nucleoside phosphorylase [bacterium]|nr:MTAP family purine nucleoside phosphorylase [bacterium]
MQNVPFALIGGSSTFSISLPEDLNIPDVKIISKNKIYQTPFGKSPALTIFEVSGKKVVTCKMHGWQGDRTRGDSSKQIFWVFKEMGVKKILAEGGVGSIDKKMKPGDVFIPDDYIDFSLRKDVKLGNDHLLVMRDPVCPDLKKSLIKAIKDGSDYKIFQRGVYAVTDGRHFESKAEVTALKRLGSDAVGQSFCPEVYLAREIGACYCGIYLVVNYAEGVIPKWDYEKFRYLFYSESKRIGNILIKAIKSLDINKDACSCKNLRMKTLLTNAEQK